MNMQTPMPRPRATYADVLAAPEHMVAEILDGELHMQSRPASKHALVMSVLASELVSPFQRGRNGPGGWWIIIEPELHMGENVMVPDLAGWRRERMPDYPDVPYFSMRPDWVCEILSPSTRRIDLYKKRPLYAEAGVSHLWLIDPIAQGLEAFTLRDGEWVLTATLAGHAGVSVAPFDAITFPLAALWGEG